MGNFALDSAKRGDYQEAISQFQQAVKECGDCQSRADLFKDMGLIECKSGDVQHGEEHLLVAKALKPDDPDIAKALAMVGGSRSKRSAERLSPEYTERRIDFTATNVLHALTNVIVSQYFIAKVRR